MTFLEKFVENNPSVDFIPVIYRSCPHLFGYESEPCDEYCYNTPCEKCWNRENKNKEENMNKENIVNTEESKEKENNVIVRVREPEGCTGVTFTYKEYFDASCLIQECLRAGKVVELEMRSE